MTRLDKRPVYKNRETERAFKNTEFYFVKYTADCPICLGFFENPQVLPCGHCYCFLCITICSEYNKSCPMCSEFFWIFKPVQFFFAQEIGDYILLRRCRRSDVSNSVSGSFHEYPYSFEYFVEALLDAPGEQKKTEDFVFYQANDGQLSFLDPRISNGMKSRPLYMFSEIKEQYECAIDHERFPELSHIPVGIRISILLI